MGGIMPSCVWGTCHARGNPLCLVWLKSLCRCRRAPNNQPNHDGDKEGNGQQCSLRTILLVHIFIMVFEFDNMRIRNGLEPILSQYTIYNFFQFNGKKFHRNPTKDEKWLNNASKFRGTLNKLADLIFFLPFWVLCSRIFKFRKKYNTATVIFIQLLAFVPCCIITIHFYCQFVHCGTYRTMLVKHWPEALKARRTAISKTFWAMFKGRRAHCPIVSVRAIQS